MSQSSRVLKRKKIIVFGVEGKDNKTETIYFHHFKPANDEYLLKVVSCGCTDPKNMIYSIKSKRKRFDYKANEDKTFLFFDGDCSEEKLNQIKELKTKLPKDITLIVSQPTFELWFLNHFVSTTKQFHSNEELISELKRFVSDYRKNLDLYPKINDLREVAISRSNVQLTKKDCSSYTEVSKLFEHNILDDRD